MVFVDDALSEVSRKELRVHTAEEAAYSVSRPKYPGSIQEGIESRLA